MATTSRHKSIKSATTRAFCLYICKTASESGKLRTIIIRVRWQLRLRPKHTHEMRHDARVLSDNQFGKCWQNCVRISSLDLLFGNYASESKTQRELQQCNIQYGFNIMTRSSQYCLGFSIDLIRANVVSFCYTIISIFCSQTFVGFWTLKQLKLIGQWNDKGCVVINSSEDRFANTLHCVILYT